MSCGAMFSDIDADVYVLVDGDDTCQDPDHSWPYANTNMVPKPIDNILFPGGFGLSY